MLKLKKELPANYLTSGVNLLYFGDKHYQYKKPANRIDDFSETEKKKVREIRRLAKEHNVRLIIQPGDFLDKPRLPDDFVQEILEEWGFSAYKRAREDYESGKLNKEELADAVLDYIPIVGTVGNHELFGGSLKTLPRTTLGFMSSIGFINLVDKDNPFFIKTAGGRSIAITGVPYDLHILKNKENFILREKKGDTDLVLIHEALYNTTLGPEVNWLPIDSVYKETKADLTIAGHIHHGFGWIEKDGKIFGNPGALAQQSSADTELDRDLYGSLIHIAEDGEIFVKDFKLDCLRSRDLFDLKVKENKNSIESQMNLVKKVVEKIDPVKSSEISDLIETIGKNDEVSKEAIELALKTTEEIESKMRINSPLDENQDYRIKQIRLKNFEAHLDTIINLPEDKVPYVFIGESSNGKSSIARAIYFVLENEGNAVGFIRRAKDIKRCEVTLVRSDNLSVTRVVELKNKKTGSKKTIHNGWIIRYPDGTETETNTSGLEEIQRLFGFNYLYLDEAEKINLNFRKQKEPDFFLGFKEKQRAKLVGSLYKAQYLLAGIKELESKRRGINLQINSQQKDLSLIEESINHLSVIEKVRKSTETIKEKNNKLDLLQKKLIKVEELKNVYLKNNSILSTINLFLDSSAQKVQRVSDQLIDLVEKEHYLNQAKNYYRNFSDITRKINKINSFIQAEPIVNNTEILLSKLENNCNLLEKVSYFKNKSNQIKKEINLENKIISHEKDIEAVESKINNLEDLNYKLLRIKVLRERFIDQNENLNKLNYFLSNNEKIIDLLLEKIETLNSKMLEFNNLEKIYSLFTSQNNQLEELKKDELEAIEEKNELKKQLKLEEEKQFIQIGDLTIFGITTIN